MKTFYKILYIQHAWLRGGSVVSLLYTIQLLRKVYGEKFHPVVILVKPAPEVQQLYVEAGIETHVWKGLYPFEHTTGGWASLSGFRKMLRFMLNLMGFPWTYYRTACLVKSFKPDLIHLNSAVLAPCAMALARGAVPVVWHVREVPAKGYFGIRKKVMHMCMMHCADEMIFLSQWERAQWVEGRRGVVIPNFVHPDAFQVGRDRGAIRKALGLADHVPCFLFVGGFSPIKGMEVLLEALREVCKGLPEVVCLMPGAIYEQPRRGGLIAGLKHRFGSQYFAKTMLEKIQLYGLENNVCLMPFSKNISELMAACDCLVFPALEPHFARPVLEAAMLDRPAIASSLGGMQELIIDQHTGWLVEAGDAQELSEAMKYIVQNPEETSLIGKRAGKHILKHCHPEENIQTLVHIYDRLLH